MPKHRKGKGKATAPMAVPSLDNRPRYRTPEVQVSVPQLPTPEPTLAVRTRIRQVSVGASVEEEEEEAQGLWSPVIAAHELAKLRALQIARGRW